MKVLIKSVIRDAPLIGRFSALAVSSYRAANFPGSSSYWEQRYAAGGDSGVGSSGRLARYKAAVVNDLCRKWEVDSVIEWGCGDGKQLDFLKLPKYVGLDVSGNAIDRCLQRHEADHGKSFFYYDPHRFVDHAGLFRADVALSLDVIYHLVEDVVFDGYMDRLFVSARKYVIIYSSNSDDLRRGAPHVRDRQFTHWVEQNRPDWELFEVRENRHPYNGDESVSSHANFYCYRPGVVGS